MLARLIGWADWIRARFDSPLARRIESFRIVAAFAGFTVLIVALMRATTPKACRSLPVRIIDLELTFSSRRFGALMQQLEARGCDSAFLNSLITWDILFPIAYAATLCALFIWAERQRRYRVDGTATIARLPRRNHIFLMMPLAAGAIDILLENIPLWIAGTLLDNPANAKSTIVSAIVRFGSLGASMKWSLVFISMLSILAELLTAARGIVLRRLRYGVVAVLLGALPLLIVPQGLDILQRSIEGDPALPGIIRALVAITFGGWVVWYCSRKLVQLRFPNDPPSSRDWYEFFAEHVPRILGIAVLVLAAAAFARAGAALPMFAAISIGGFIAASLADKFLPRATRYIGRLLVHGYLRIVDGLDQNVGRAVIALFIGLAIIYAPNEPRDFLLLRRAAYLLLMIAWLFYLHVYSRRGRIAAREAVKVMLPAIGERLETIRGKSIDVVADVYRYEVRHLEAESVSSLDAKHLDRAITRALMIGMFMSIAGLIAFIWWPVPVARWLGSLIILALAVASVVFYGSIATWVRERHRVPILPIALGFAALFSVWNDSHLVRRLPGNPAPIFARRDIPAQYALWRADSASGSGPVVLVAAAGGGLRAAYWTAATLAALQDSIPDFNRHVFAISAVSGGSLGAAVYAALVRDSVLGSGRVKCLAGKSIVSPGLRPYSTCVREFMAEDFLSPVLAKMVAPDFVQSFLPFPWRQLDRSLALEESWEDSYESVTGMPTMREGFLALYRGYPSPSTVPSLFLNATHVETGKRYITTPITRGDITPPPGGRPQTMHDSQDLLELLGSDLRLSSAAHNSARFTYVSPPGRIQRGDTLEYGHVVDGGYFENSGLATLREILDEIRERDSRAKPVVLYLCNDPLSCRDKLPQDSLPTTQRSAIIEWSGPIRALLSTRDARGSLSRADIADLPNVEFVQLDVCDALIAADLTDGEASTLGSRERENQGRERVVSPPLGWLLSKVARDWMDSSLTPGVDSLKPSGCRRRNAQALKRLHVLLMGR